MAYHAIITPLSEHSLGGGLSEVHCVAFATISRALRMYELLATPPDTTWKNRGDELTNAVTRIGSKLLLHWAGGGGGGGVRWGGTTTTATTSFIQQETIWGLTNEYLHNKNLEIPITGFSQHVFAASTLNISLVSVIISATFAITIHQYFRLHLHFWFCHWATRLSQNHYL